MSSTTNAVPQEFPPMQYVRLGSTGMKVSRICLGMMTYGDPDWEDWVLNEEQSLPFIKRALYLGINFFDSADMYSNGVSEVIMGNAIKKWAKRDEVVLTSKCFFGLKKDINARGLSRKHVMQAIDDSLKRIDTPYVDLYQIHRWDNDTPIEETMEALHDIVKAGKARYIGASSMYAWQFAKAQRIAKERGFTQFVSMQNHYNLIYREEEREMIPCCKDLGVGLIPWSPYAKGLLCGNRKRAQEASKKVEGETLRAKTDEYATKWYVRGHTAENDFEIIDRVCELAKKKNVSAAQISLAWLLHKPGVAAPIIGASKMNHLEEAVKALNVKLTEEEMKYLEELYLPHTIAGHM